MTDPWTTVARTALALLVPVVLVLTNVRLLMTHAFPRYEYQRPSFPADPYGFTAAERLHWGTLAVDYLLNDRGVDFLAEMHFPDGTRLYNERELQHMRDVKRVVQIALGVWALAGLLSAALAGGLWLAGERAALRAGLAGGAIVTLVALGAVLLTMWLAFNWLFVRFHELFFASGTWTFPYSDTLIRLFPLPFWQDAFLFIGVASVVEAVVLWRVAGRL